MAKLKTCILLLIVAFSSMIVMAQDGRALLTKIERETQDNEPEWKLERRTANETGVMMLWGCSESLVRVNIYTADSVEIAHDWYKGTGVKPDGETGSITKLDGFGEEGALMKDYLRKGNVGIMFRKGKTVVQVVGNSEAVVRRFAQHVLKTMTAI